MSLAKLDIKSTIKDGVGRHSLLYNFTQLASMTDWQKKYKNMAKGWPISGFRFNTPPIYESDVLTLALLNYITQHMDIFFQWPVLIRNETFTVFLQQKVTEYLSLH